MAALLPPPTPETAHFLEMIKSKPTLPQKATNLYIHATFSLSIKCLEFISLLPNELLLLSPCYYLVLGPESGLQIERLHAWQILIRLISPCELGP